MRSFPKSERIRSNCHNYQVLLGVLGALNRGRCIKEYSDLLSLDIVPTESFTLLELPALLGTPLVDEHMEMKLANFQEAMYALVVARELLTVTSGYGAMSGHDRRHWKATSLTDHYL
jgi:hypothetical protein